MKRLLEHAQPGDTVVVWRIDRLGRSLIIERVNAGITAARSSGTQFGRPTVDPIVIAEKLTAVRAARAKGQTASRAVKIVGWSRATLYRYERAAGLLDEAREAGVSAD